MGGHCRTGLEDNVRWDKNRLAKSNAELVKRVAGLSAEYGRVVASPGIARKILGSGNFRTGTNLNWSLSLKSWALIERPYSKDAETVAAVYDGRRF